MGRRGKSRASVIRAERFEAVDREGHRRLTVGVIGRGPDGEQLAGMDVFDLQGRSMLTVAVDETGYACMSFASGGNEVLVLGGRRSADGEGRTEPHVELLNEDGTETVLLEGQGRATQSS